MKIKYLLFAFCFLLFSFILDNYTKKSDIDISEVDFYDVQFKEVWEQGCDFGHNNIRFNSLFIKVLYDLEKEYNKEFCCEEITKNDRKNIDRCCCFLYSESSGYLHDLDPSFLNPDGNSNIYVKRNLSNAKELTEILELYKKHEKLRNLGKEEVVGSPLEGSDYTWVRR